MGLKEELLAILVCPRCKEKVELTADQQWLLCRQCRLRYPIRDEIPVMLIDEAEPLADDN